MKSGTKFSKSTVHAYIEQRTTALKQQHGLDPNKGTAQLHGRDEAAAVAYGEMRALLNLSEAIVDGNWDLYLDRSS